MIMPPDPEEEDASDGMTPEDIGEIIDDYGPSAGN